MSTIRDRNRCAVCGWPLQPSVEQGCVRGNCSQRPRPSSLYDGMRAAAESTTTRDTANRGAE